jgi:hypothetical protein
VLFLNIFSCAEGMGNPINGMPGIAPPTVSDQLMSATNNLLIPLVTPDGEDNNFGPETESNN